MKILVLNGGSSSFKSSLFDVAGHEGSAAPNPLWEARVDWARLVLSTFKLVPGHSTSQKNGDQGSGNRNSKLLSVFYAALGQNSLLVGVLHFAHFGDGVGE